MITADQTRFQKYYEDRKEEFSERRKERYRDDPEYREKQKRAAREYRERRKVGGKKNLDDLRKSRPMEFTSIDGNLVELHTMARLTELVGRSSHSIYKWIRQGQLPETPYRSVRYERMWTDGMADVIRREVEKRKIVQRDDESLCEDVVAGWRELGVEVKGYN